MKIWLDADACPKMVKELVFKASAKRQVEVVLVANTGIYIPQSSLISMVVVSADFDAADQYIVKECEPGDLVITADIPLASEIVDKKVVAMNPRGKIYTPENIKDALSMRNLREELRGGGMVAQGGPPPLGPKDKEKFANSFDREVTRLL